MQSSVLAGKFKSNLETLRSLHTKQLEDTRSDPSVWNTVNQVETSTLRTSPDSATRHAVGSYESAMEPDGQDRPDGKTSVTSLSAAPPGLSGMENIHPLSLDETSNGPGEAGKLEMGLEKEPSETRAPAERSAEDLSVKSLNSEYDELRAGASAESLW